MIIPECMIKEADDIAEWGANNPEKHPGLSAANIRSAMLLLKPQEKYNDTENPGRVEIHHWISNRALPEADV